MRNRLSQDETCHLTHFVDVGPFAGPADYMSPRSYTPSMYMTQGGVKTIPDPAGCEPEREAPRIVRELPIRGHVESPASSSLGSTILYSPEHFTRMPDSQAGVANEQPGGGERLNRMRRKSDLSPTQKPQEDCLSLRT